MRGVDKQFLHCEAGSNVLYKGKAGAAIFFFVMIDKSSEDATQPMLNWSSEQTFLRVAT